MLLVTIRYLWLLNEEFCPAPNQGRARKLLGYGNHHNQKLGLKNWKHE
jgi:hypothetical protein